jgi:uncharacterized lipoprotein YddW (UPF0748 family)
MTATALTGCYADERVQAVNAGSYVGVEYHSEVETVSADTPPLILPPTTSSHQDTTQDTTSAYISTTKQTTGLTTKPPRETTTSPATSATKPKTTTTAKQTTAAETSAVTSLTTAPPSATDKTAIKAVWFSYIELSPILLGKSESQFKQSFSAMLDDIKTVGANTAIVHVRPFGDALYWSDYYPNSRFYDGYIGGNASFDALSAMCDVAKAQGITLYAWVNPFRTESPTLIKTIQQSHAVKVGTYYYLDPGYADVRTLIANGAAELAANYDIAGVIIDDYFYPTTDKSFDKQSFEASGKADLSAFRFDNCTDVVKQMRAACNKQGKLFGIAPQGNVGNNYSTLYADVKLWSSSTVYCDIMLPQIYYGFKNSGAPFDKCLAEWTTLVKGTGVKLAPSLCVYKAGTEDTWAGDGKFEWQTDSGIVKKQIDLIESQSLWGYTLYSYNFMFTTGYATEAMKKEVSFLF